MAASTEPRFGLQYGWALGESGWNAGMDANLLKLGRFGVHLSAKNRNLTVAPTGPSAGDTHIVAAGATGTWAGHDNQVAIWDGSVWQYAVPRSGWRADVEGEDIQVRFRSGTWGTYPGGGGGTGEANTASNLGGGAGLAAGKSGVDLRFKSLVNGAGITLSADANTVTIGTTAGASDGSTALGSLVKWNAAKARGAANPARFAFLGDSNVAGQGSGSGTANLTGAALTSMARKFAALAGFNTASFFGDQNTALIPVAANVYDSRLALGTGWAADSTASGIFGGRFFKSVAGPSGRLGFAPGVSFTKFRLWYPTLSGLNTAVTVYVDGTLVDTFSQDGTTAFLYKDYTVSAGTHTIEIGAGATGSAFVAGIETFDGATTPKLLQGGWCGAKAADLNSAANPWNNRPGLVTLAPDFSLVYCTINDATGGTAGDAYYTNIEGLVAALSAVSDGCLCVGYPANNAAVLNGGYESFARILKAIAADYGWFFYDCRRDLGRSYARATAKGYVYDTVHPNLAGHNAVAAGLYSFLSGAGL